MKLKYKVLIIQRRLPIYRTALFDHLRERLSAKNIELSLVHGSPSRDEILKKDETSLPWATKVRSRYLRIAGSDLCFMPLPDGMIRKQNLIIMPHENSMVINYLLLARRYVAGSQKLAFFGHGRNFQSEQEEGFRGWLRKKMIPLVDWWFAYTALSVKQIIDAGFDANKITCLNNAIDTSEQRSFAGNIGKDEKDELLRRLGLCGKNCAVFLGSLYKHKRLEFLVQSADELRKRIHDFELLLIGDGPQRDMVREFVADRPWIKCAGAQFGKEKVLYASLGKIMLNPGLVGLGILDSFSLGIPLITTDCAIHSPEIAYLENNKNGIMTEDRVDAFVDAAESLFKDRNRLDSLKKQCLKDSEKYTLDAMVNNFVSGIENTLGLEK